MPVFQMLLILFLLLCLLPVPARAEDMGSCGKDATWKLDDEGTLTISGTGGAEVKNRNSIPWSTYSVKAVRVEDGITSIGPYMFYNHTKLEKLELGGTVTSLGERAFGYCTALTSVSIPDSVETIGDNAFDCCYALSEIEFGGGSPVMGHRAFAECTALQSVHIPGSIEKVGEYAFTGCEGLKEVILGDGVRELGEGAFYDCAALTSVNIPDSVSRIGDMAFSFCPGLTEIRIPAGTAEVGERAFEYCDALSRIDVDRENPDLASVDGVLFSRDMTRLLTYPAGRPDEAYVIPDTVTDISSGAFNGAANVQTVTFPGSVKSAGFGYYEGLSSLKKVVLLDGVETIAEEAFAGCDALEEVVFPETLRTIKAFAFQDTGLKSAILPESVEVLEDHAFYDSAVKEVYVPGKVTALPEAVFLCCYDLETVTVPGSVKEIGPRAFQECGQLKTVYLGEGVETVGPDAFDQCDSLSEVYYGGTKASWRAIRNLSVELLGAKVYDKNGREILPEFPDLVDLGECGEEMVWYYCQDGTLTIRGAGSMEDYWYKTDISYDSGGTRYETSDFTYPWNQYGKEIKTVVVEEGVERIGQSAFSQIETLSTAYLPLSLKKVGDGAFNNTGLVVVHYAGTGEQWSGVAKGMYNEPLKEAHRLDWNAPPEMLMELREQNGLEFTLALFLEEEAQICVAWFSEEGGFVGCSLTTVGADVSEYKCLDAPGGAARCRVFLTDTDHSPLCGAVSVTL